jgi:GTP-binding protein EngB required for normal cell division
MCPKQKDAAKRPTLVIALGRQRVGKSVLLNTAAPYGKLKASSRKPHGNQLKTKGKGND